MSQPVRATHPCAEDLAEVGASTMAAELEGLLLAPEQGVCTRRCDEGGAARLALVFVEGGVHSSVFSSSRPVSKFSPPKGVVEGVGDGAAELLLFVLEPGAAVERFSAEGKSPARMRPMHAAKIAIHCQSSMLWEQQLHGTLLMTHPMDHHACPCIP